MMKKQDDLLYKFQLASVKQQLNQIMPNSRSFYLVKKRRCWEEISSQKSVNQKRLVVTRACSWNTKSRKEVAIFSNSIFIFVKAYKNFGINYVAVYKDINVNLWKFAFEIIFWDAQLNYQRQRS